MARTSASAFNSNLIFAAVSGRRLFRLVPVAADIFEAQVASVVEALVTVAAVEVLTFLCCVCSSAFFLFMVLYLHYLGDFLLMMNQIRLD